MHAFLLFGLVELIDCPQLQPRKPDSWNHQGLFCLNELSKWMKQSDTKEWVCSNCISFEMQGTSNWLCSYRTTRCTYTSPALIYIFAMWEKNNCKTQIIICLPLCGSNINSHYSKLFLQNMLGTSTEMQFLAWRAHSLLDSAPVE